MPFLRSTFAATAPRSAVAELGVVCASEAGATRVQVPPLEFRLFTSATCGSTAGREAGV